MVGIVILLVLLAIAAVAFTFIDIKNEDSGISIKDIKAKGKESKIDQLEQRLKDIAFETESIKHQYSAVEKNLKNSSVNDNVFVDTINKQNQDYNQLKEAFDRLSMQEKEKTLKLKDFENQLSEIKKSYKNLEQRLKETPKDSSILQQAEDKSLQNLQLKNTIDGMYVDGKDRIDDIVKKIDSVENYLAQQDKKIDEVKNISQIEDFKKEIGLIKASFSDIEKALKQAVDKESKIEREVQSQDVDRRKIKEDLSVLDKKEQAHIDDILQRIEVVQNEINSQNEKLSDIEKLSQIKSLQEEIALIEKRYSDMKDAVSQTMEKEDALKQKILDEEKNMVEIRANLDNMQTEEKIQIKQIVEKIENIQNKVVAQDNKLKDVEKISKIDSLQKEVGKINDEHYKIKEKLKKALERENNIEKVLSSQEKLREKLSTDLEAFNRLQEKQFSELIEKFSGLQKSLEEESYFTTQIKKIRVVKKDKEKQKDLVIKAKNEVADKKEIEREEKIEQRKEQSNLAKEQLFSDLGVIEVEKPLDKKKAKKEKIEEVEDLEQKKESDFDPLVSKKSKKKKIGQILLERKLITESMLKEALNYQRKFGGGIVQYLIAFGYLNEDDLARCVSAQYGVPYISLKMCEVHQDVIDLIPPAVALKYCLVPVGQEGNLLTVIMADPLDTRAVKELEEITGFTVIPYVGIISEIIEGIEQYYNTSVDLKKSLGQKEVPLYVHTDFYKGADRRDVIRMPVSVDLTYSCRRGKIQTKTKDISSTGLLFESHDLFNAGSTVVLVLNLPAQIHGTAIEITAQVVRVVIAEASFDIGVRFTNIKEKELNLILEYCNQQVKKNSKK